MFLAAACQETAAPPAAITIEPTPEARLRDHRQEIIANARAQIAKRDFAGVTSMLAPYQSLHDPEVDQILRIAAISTLRQAIDTTPEWEHAELASIYREIRTLDPKDAEAAKAYKQHQAKVDAVVKMSAVDLCRAWKRSQDPFLRDRLLASTPLTEGDLRYLEKRQITIGMAEVGLQCAWGEPRRVNRTVFADHVHKQYVFEDRYVYVEDGYITSLQD